MGRSNMIISYERLMSESEKTGFRAGMLEKVIHLLELLNTLNDHPFLKGKFVLKGGTALNLFIFDIPRLSVDIDLNYVGIEERDKMLAERQQIERALQDIFKKGGFLVKQLPDEHAGGKWLLRYNSVLGQMGNLEVDINFMYRVPIWPIKSLNSKSIGIWQASRIPVINDYELIAGKLVALLTRKKSRDLFDIFMISKHLNIDFEKLRLAFTVYGAMSRKDLRTISVDDVAFDINELKNQLVPTLNINHNNNIEDINKFGQLLVTECKNFLSKVLPFRTEEIEFLNLLFEKGEIKPDILTDDTRTTEQIAKQPMLKWKALNVKNHKGIV
jgi:predicted nucleotidyltransferase component of viral defense system